MGESDGMDEGQGVGKVERGRRRETAPKASAVGIAVGPVYGTYKWFNTGGLWSTDPLWVCNSNGCRL